MKAVILAAGDGGRLEPLTRQCPKVLLPLGGRPLIWYPLQALLAAGATGLAVVTGHRARRVRTAVAQVVPDGLPVAFLSNSLYRHGNALSLAAAAAWAGDEPFLLVMGDHILEPEIACRLVAGWRGGLAACVDSAASSRQINDATRVLTDATGRLQAIGKGLPAWNAVDVGLFLLDRRVFPAIERLRQARGPDLELGEVLASLLCDGVPFATCDVAGLSWADVDTPEDYEAAVRALEG